MRFYYPWFRIATAVVVALCVVAATGPAHAQDGVPDDDVTVATFGNGGGGEPLDPLPPAPTTAEENDGQALAATTSTRTLVRTKKIPAAGFTGPEIKFESGGGCAYPSDGNTPMYAAVTGLPQGATVTQMFVEGFAESAESEDFVVALKWSDGDGASATMAVVSSSGGGFNNLTDSTIDDSVISGLGGVGRSYFVVFDADNNDGLDIVLDDHQVCHVWITYEVTETYIANALSLVPTTPCAELDTRPGLPGYTFSEGGAMTPGETRSIDMTTTTCNIAGQADGFVVSVFLINLAGINWLNVYDASLPTNDEAVIVGSPSDPLESVSLFVPDSALGGDDIKLTMGGEPGASAHVKLVITGFYYVEDQPLNRYTD